jgi:hypothetical protein
MEFHDYIKKIKYRLCWFCERKCYSFVGICSDGRKYNFTFQDIETTYKI